MLRSSVGTFVIGQGENDSCSIGTNKCSINLQSSSLEDRHAVIEYSYDSRAYTLRDLHTNSGTYVNGSRVRRDSVAILNSGDVIRFGRDQTEFTFEESNQRTLPRTPSLGGSMRHPANSIVHSSMSQLPSMGNGPRFSERLAPINSPMQPERSFARGPRPAWGSDIYVPKPVPQSAQQLYPPEQEQQHQLHHTQLPGFIPSVRESHTLQQRDDHVRDSRMDNRMDNITHYKTELRQKDGIILSLENELGEFKERLERSANLADRLRVLEQDYEDEKTITRGLKAELRDMEMDLDAAKESASNLKTENANLREELTTGTRDLEEEKKTIEDLSRQLDDATRRLNEHKTDQDNLLSQLRGDLSKTIDERDSLSAQLSQSAADLAATQERLAGMEAELLSHQDAMQNMAQLQENLEQSLTQVASLTKKSSEQQIELNVLKDVVSSYKNNVQEAANILKLDPKVAEESGAALVPAVMQRLKDLKREMDGEFEQRVKDYEKENRDWRREKAELLKQNCVAADKEQEMQLDLERSKAFTNRVGEIAELTEEEQVNNIAILAALQGRFNEYKKVRATMVDLTDSAALNRGMTAAISALLKRQPIDKTPLTDTSLTLFGQLEEFITELDRLREESVKSADTKVAELERQKLHLESTIVGLKNIIETNSAEAETRTKELDEKLQESQTKLSSVLDELAEVRRESDTLATEFDATKTALRQLQQEHEDTTGELSQAQAKVQELAQDLLRKNSSLKDLEGTLQYSQTSSTAEVTKQKQANERLRQQLQTLTSDRDSAKDTITTLQKRLADSQDFKKFRELEKSLALANMHSREVEARLTDVKGEIEDELKTRVRELEEQIKALEKERDGLTEQVEASKRGQSVTIAQLTARLETKTKQLKALEGKLASVMNKDDHLVGAEQKIEQLEHEIQIMKTQMEEKDEQLQLAAKELNDALNAKSEDVKSATRRLDAELKAVKEKSRAQYKQLEENAKSIKQLRVTVLETEAACTKVKEELEEEVKNVKIGKQMLKQSVDQYSTMVRTVSKEMGLEVEPLRSNLLQPPKGMSEEEIEQAEQDWRDHCNRITQDIAIALSKTTSKLNGMPDEIANVKDSAKAERDRLRAKYEERLAHMKTKLGRQDSLLATYDSDLSKLSEYKDAALMAESAVKGLESTVKRLKSKVGEQRTTIIETQEKLEEQIQLCNALTQQRQIEKPNQPTAESHGHSCTHTDDLEQQLAKMKALYTGKLKQKNVLIQTLKRQLQGGTEKRLSSSAGVYTQSPKISSSSLSKTVTTTTVRRSHDSEDSKVTQSLAEFKETERRINMGQTIIH